MIYVWTLADGRLGAAPCAGWSTGTPGDDAAEPALGGRHLQLDQLIELDLAGGIKGNLPHSVDGLMRRDFTCESDHVAPRQGSMREAPEALVNPARDRRRQRQVPPALGMGRFHVRQDVLADCGGVQAPGAGDGGRRWG
jgi:hypothetical protein